MNYEGGYQQQANNYDQFAAQPYGASSAHAPTKYNTPDEEKIEKTLLLITWVSIFNCIMKLDYNAAIYLFLYYLWITRTDTKHYKAFLIANGVFLGCDILWFLMNMGSWSGSYSEDESQTANFLPWTSFRIYHIFTLIICVVIMIIKLVLLYLQNKVRGGENQNQGNASGHQAGYNSANRQF